MRIQFHRAGVATHLGTAAALIIGSFIGCAQVLDIHQWEDPPGSTGSSSGSGGVGGTDQDAARPCEPSEAGATCADCEKNGDETAVDCGGDACGPCALGMTCLHDGDCDTSFCSDGVCSTRPADASTCEPSDAGATCADCLMNGLETDVDCGGDSCDPCVIGQKCSSDFDCTKGSRCSNLICSPS